MLPLYLSIQGLYSYQEKQEIDFSKLTEAGLFGIFGNVGSGKSSILEAISYALYGETERLNKQEKRAYNMLNLKSNHAIIDFHFLNFENRKFRFTAQWKRRKRFEDISTIERTAYEWKDDKWIPMESADGALITNLSYSNFRRTIIIPQGQFKEFLELKGKDRSDMMKEIFLLNKYDLGPKVGILQAENNRHLENIKGALSGFEDITEENKEIKVKELSEERLELESLRSQHKTWSESLKNLNHTHSIRQELQNLNQELDVLESQRPKIQEQEKELLAYESVVLNFKEPITKLKDLQSDKTDTTNKVKLLSAEQELLSQNIAKYTQQLASITDDYSKLDIYKKQLLEIEILVRNVDLVISQKELKSRLEKGIPMLSQQQSQEIQLNAEITQAEENLELLKNKRLNTSELLSIESWYQTRDELDRQIVTIEHQKLAIDEDLNSLHQKFNEHQYTFDNWKENLDQELIKHQIASEDIAEKESALLLKEELSQFVMNLHEGQPCPLCGAKEHPNVMHTADLSVERRDLTQKKHQLAASEASLRLLYTNLTTTSKYVLDKLDDKKAKENELNKLVEEKKLHHHKFIWKEFDENNKTLFEAKKAFIVDLEETIRTRELSLKNLRNSLSVVRDNVQKYQKSIDEIQNKIESLSSNIAQNRSMIKELTSLLFNNHSKDELNNMALQITSKINTVESNYKLWNMNLQANTNELATVKGQLNELNIRLERIKQDEIELNTLTQSLLITFLFKDIEEVESILNKRLDVVTIKETIQQYTFKINTLTTRVEELNKYMINNDFSEEALKEANDKVEELLKLLELEISKIGAIEKDLERIENELIKKLHLIKEFNSLNERKENLKLLDNMFKGNGFVNYVSSIHLERLCEIANNRFHRLTKNQLSLCINENNEFEVKDFLNNGYQRSIKTLSGGQSFQASLCLALALAESIQALNKADRNFFFIDEGFGTQDTESINIVFDTLQYLHQENRVVGIISHVEELKERMPRSITITNNIEKGSQVNYN